MSLKIQFEKKKKKKKSKDIGERREIQKIPRQRQAIQTKHDLQK